MTHLELFRAFYGRKNRAWRRGTDVNAARVLTGRWRC